MNTHRDFAVRPEVAWFLASASCDDVRMLVEAHPFLLSDEALVLVDRLAQQEAHVLPDDAWWLMAKCAFLRRCREAGIERAHEEMLRNDEAIAAYMSAQTLESSRHLVEQYPVLLTDLAMAHVDAWASGGGRDDPAQAAVLHDQALFLRRCRQIGVAAAYAERRRKS